MILVSLFKGLFKGSIEPLNLYL